MREVCWGILGCGDVTERKSGPAFNRIPGSRLVAVMRRDAAKAADYAQRHGVPRWYQDAEALTHDAGVDAVYIATPPGAHAELALRVAAVGKPCYVEKPMGRNLAEASAMVDAFSRAGHALFVAYYRRCLPRFRKIKALLDEGQLGEVQSMDYRQSSGANLNLSPGNVPWRFQPEQSGGGLFVDLGSHTLDLLDHWFGPLVLGSKEVHGNPFLPGIEDRVDITFTSVAGVPGRARWSFVDTQALDRLELRTNLGCLSCSIFGLEDVEWVPDKGATTLHAFAAPDPIQQPLIEEIVSALVSGSECRSTGTSALRTRALMDWVLDDTR